MFVDEQPFKLFCVSVHGLETQFGAFCATPCAAILGIGVIDIKLSRWLCAQQLDLIGHRVTLGDPILHTLADQPHMRAGIGNGGTQFRGQRHLRDAGCNLRRLISGERGAIGQADISHAIEGGQLCADFLMVFTLG